MENFFTTEQVKKSLSALASDRKYRELEEPYKGRFQTIRKIVESMLKNGEKWDQSCQFNITHIGKDTFLTRINILTDDIKEGTETKEKQLKQLIDDIYSACFRFLLELELNIDHGHHLGMHLGDCKERIIQDDQPMNDSVKSQIDWAANRMASSILRYYYNHPNIAEVRRFNENIKKAEDWTDKLSKKQDEVNEIRSRLDELKYSYNFVGLHKGFERLAAQKRKEKIIAIVLLTLIGILILIPLVTKVVILTSEPTSHDIAGDFGTITTPPPAQEDTKKSTNNETFTHIKTKFRDMFSQNQIALFITVLSIEIILIYYFRIILGNYSSVKAQLLQIELRKSLCEFIQSYAEYSSKIGKDNKETLKSFENIVFSGIAVEESQVPTTFDGLDQIEKLLKAIR